MHIPRAVLRRGMALNHMNKRGSFKGRSRWVRSPPVWQEISKKVYIEEGRKDGEGERTYIYKMKIATEAKDEGWDWDARLPKRTDTKLWKHYTTVKSNDSLRIPDNVISRLSGTAERDRA